MHELPPARKRLYVSILGLLMAVLCSTSCERSRTAPTVLLITVEGLLSSDIDCTIHSDPDSGFGTLCRDFVSLNSVIAPTNSIVGNAAALVTGRPPQDWGILTDEEALPPTAVTWPEEAHQQGWSTGFFASAAPISRRSNLTQGFAYADENLMAPPKPYFRAFQSSVGSFLKWQQATTGRKRLAWIHVSDLRFPRLPTTTKTGETRPLGIQSQVEELDESLDDLLSELRQNSADWEHTVILLVGLGGRPTESAVLRPRAELGRQMILPAFVHLPKSLPEGSVKGTWSLADIGAWLGEQVLAKAAPAAPLETLKIRSQNIIPAQACQKSLVGLKICRWVFFDSETWIEWDENVDAGTPERRALLAEVETHRQFSELPRHSPSLGMRWTQDESSLTAPETRCLTDFFSLKQDQTYSDVCPFTFAQNLRQWMLARRAGVDDSQEVTLLRGRMNEHWQQLSESKDLWESMGEPRPTINWNLKLLKELSTVDALLRNPDIKTLVQQVLDRPSL